MKKVLFLVLIILALCCSAAQAEENTILGQPFPDFTATDTGGNTFTLSEALKDHEAVLVNLWATWCPPCAMEMPFLEEAYRQYGDRVAFIALSTEENDTPELIESYRKYYGLSFPMGRDEGMVLDEYIPGVSIPRTVIIDRFGNAAFLHSGSFVSPGEISRTIEYFLGEGYTETAPINEIPKETSTAAFPVSAERGLYVENENVRSVIVHAEEVSLPVQTYIVYDDTARLRLEAGAGDIPSDLICFNYMENTTLEFTKLWDPEQGKTVYEVSMPVADDSPHWNYVSLMSASSGDSDDGAEIYLVSGDEFLQEFLDEMTSWGYTVSWEDAPAPAEPAEPAAYILHVIDQDGTPVPDVRVKFCTDLTCMMQKSDESGTVTFAGEPDVYHVELYKVPEGYSFDPDFELVTGKTYSEWVLRIRKN